MLALPLELVFEIAQHAWNSNLLPAERRALLSSSLLVNTLWNAAFTAALATDVHILDRPFMRYYFKLLDGKSVIFRLTIHPRVLNDICRSLTLYISNDTLPSIRSRSEPEAGKLLSDLLNTLKRDHAVPNLKSLKIHFQNVSCEDIIRYHRFVDFPVQVERLELEYTFTSSLPRWTIPVPHLLPPGDTPNWILPSVRHLRVVGGLDDLMKLAFACPKIQSLEMESCWEWYQGKKVMQGECPIRTLFFRGLPAKYQQALPQQSEDRPLQKVFVATEDVVMADDGALTLFWWISHDLSLGDIADYKNVQRIRCQYKEVAYLFNPGRFRVCSE